eukprot:6205843-Pleurochrysis_carterae.AAC.4
MRDVSRGRGRRTDHSREHARYPAPPSSMPDMHSSRAPAQQPNVPTTAKRHVFLSTSDDYLDGFGPELLGDSIEHDLESEWLGEAESVHSEGKDDWADCADGGVEEEELVQDRDDAAADDDDKPGDPRHPSPPKLWSKAEQFPSGCKGPLCYDFVNLFAAQNWECPCTDRASCLSPDRLKGQEIYEHRKDFQLSAPGKNGKRDCMRNLFEQHFSRDTI